MNLGWPHIHLKLARREGEGGLGSSGPGLAQWQALTGGALRGSSADGCFSVPCRKHLLALSLPTRHPGMGWPRGVPWGGRREGTWARQLAGRKCRCLSQHPILASYFPGKTGGWASLGSPRLGPRATWGGGGLVHSWPSWLLVSLKAGSAGLASAFQASSLLSLWEFGA